ncbi:M48 family metallopeptidase [Fervidobacterium riparium]|uniref:M48 family metallopeptidase n=1 Tax=Fervidobacterium gondwanense TaxID=44754 RepID=UPI00093311A6|nr:SprT family zinc-dependent metalloprotease [Fervidobacterium gondwanense]
MHKNTRKISIYIDYDGTLKISVPKSMTEKELEQFLKRKESEIKKLVESFSAQKSAFTSKNAILYFGEERKIILNGDSNVPLRYVNGTFFLNPRYVDDANKLAIWWLRKQAEEYLPKKVNEISEIMGISYKKVVVKDAKTRWGSCSTKGTISLNWRLIMAPVGIVEYVIVHELAHIAHPDHSPEFWRFVGKFVPDYRLFRNWLKKNGKSLFLWSLEITPK